MNTVYQPFEAQEPKEKPSYTTRDFVFALVFIFVGLLFSLAMPFRSSPLAVLLASVVLFVQTALCYGKGAIAKKRRSILLLSLYALFLVPFLTNANATLRFFVFLFLMLLLAFYWYDKTVLSYAPIADGKLLSHIGDAALLYVKRYSASFGAIKTVLGSGERSKKGWRTVGYVMLGLVVALVPTFIIGILLSYDDSFMGLMNDIFDFSFDKVFERFWDIIVAILLGAAFYSLMRSSLHKEELRQETIKAELKTAVARPILYAAVTPMLLLYALFFFSQKDYYLSAFTHVLPEGFTYAAYAREGFFQLCLVACINAVVLLCFSLLMKKKEGSREILCRIYQGVLSLFTLILIATALSKMVLYINRFGLTHKRVYASWLMALLALAFIVILIKQFWQKLPFVKVAILSAILMFALITLPNIDGMIANYNVDRYLDGSLETVDIEELEELGIASVEARVRLEAAWQKKASLTDEEQVALSALSAGLDNEKAELDDSFWAFSIPHHRAKRLLEKRG